MRIALDAGGALDEAYAYSSKVGCLNHQGGCASLAEIPAENRRFPALTQVEMLAAICERLSPGTAVDDFIRAHVGDPELRAARSAALRTGALPALYPRRTILEL